MSKTISITFTDEEYALINKVAKLKNVNNQVFVGDEAIASAKLYMQCAKIFATNEIWERRLDMAEEKQKQNNGA